MFIFQINIVIDKINADIKPKKKLVRIKEEEFRFLADYVSCLKAVAVGLDLLQGDKEASLGYVLPTLYTIKIEINRAHLITEHRNTIRTKLMNCFDQRFFNIMEICEANKTYIMASISHPKFKLSWLPENDLDIAEKMFIDICLNLESNAHRNNIDENVQSDNDDDGYFVSFNRQDRRRSEEFISKILEIVQYLENCSRKKEILHLYPTVRYAFLKFNTTLASSAPVERMFSKALLLFGPRRNSMSATNFEYALLLEQNEIQLLLFLSEILLKNLEIILR